MTSPGKTPVTSRNALFTYYDIESLQNAFTLCSYNPRTNVLEVFYLLDDPSIEVDIAVLADVVAERNPSYQDRPGAPRHMVAYDLREWRGNQRLAQVFGLSDADSVNDPGSPSSYGPWLRPVCDTDPGYDPLGQHPYLAGYNSYNYDTTMLAVYFMEAFVDLARAVHDGRPQDAPALFRPVTAAGMRRHNDQLFSPAFKEYMPRYLTDGSVAGSKGWNSSANKIRQAFLHSGRHIDIAMLNEVQRRIGLKRLLGGQGRQILESDRLGSHNARIASAQDLYELLAYNVSDVVGLAQLAQHPTYASGFDLKKGLLDEYPETVYQPVRGTHRPDVRPQAVRRDRLAPDSTSAKFVGKILSPYGKLTDIPAVSFLYPSEQVAAERGVERRNVLEDCRDFFYEHVADPSARAQFDEVYQYYRSIEGLNFNDSQEYADTYSLAEHPPHVLKDVPKRPNNIPYFNADGSPSTCFATFSTGGIHGAEADVAAYEADSAEWHQWQAFIEAVRAVSPDPLTIRLAKEMEVPMPDGSTAIVPYKDVLTSKSTIKALKERSEAITALGPDPDPADVAEVESRFPGVGWKPGPKRPELFEPSPDRSNKLKAKYTHTSAGAAIHEDFTSYYPNMLRNMSAFYNPDLGEDRYAKILADKDRYGVMMKDPSLSRDEVERLKVLRNGTKLILNSASGAGDTTFGNSPIRVNNQIISMRIIGQLFSWRIGQAQTLAGGRIISTNTDGLYSVLDEETNNRVLAEQQALINVEIEPEPLVIVSKDSNNRLEMLPPADGQEPWEARIVGASGGTLACYEGPRPDKALAHPAVLDWALARYLRYIAGGYTPKGRKGPVSLEEPLDRELALRLMLEARDLEDGVLAARLFQNMIASSNGKITIPFASDPVPQAGADDEGITNARPLQHHNRVFYVHPGKPGAVSLRSAGAWVINPATRLNRQKNGLQAVSDDPVAMQILEANGFTRRVSQASDEGFTLLPVDQDVAVRRINSIDPSWSALVVNEDLHCMGEARLRDLLGCLDLGVYVELLADTYEKNWMNGAA